MHIDQPIDLYVAFRNGLIKPIAFLWHDKAYKIDTVTLAYQERQGTYTNHYFCVMVKHTYYKIILHGGTNIATLIESEVS